MNDRSPRNGYRTYLFALVIYVILTLALTWPLIAHFTTHVPGSAVWAFDESTFLWNMWWFRFSLLELGQSPLYTDYIFYPLGTSLVTYTFNFFNAALGLPLVLAFSIPLASNVVIWFALVMSALGGFLLVRYLLTRASLRGPGASVAAFVAGSVYAFAASRMVYLALGHYNFATVEWFPFFILFLLKTLREPKWTNPLLAGLFVALSLYAEMTFGVLLFFCALILLPFEWAAARQRLFPLVGRLVTLVLVVLILWAPLLLPTLQAYREGGFELPGWGEGLKLSADLVGWFTPTALHPLFGAADWPAYLRAVVERHTPFEDVNTVFLGFGILALSLFGAKLAWRHICAWAWAAVIFAVLTLGPLLQIRGRYLFSLDRLLPERGVTIPLPFVLLHYIPIIKANRVPNRFSIVLSLSFAVLVGFGLAVGLRRVRRPMWAGVAGCFALGVVLFDQISVPLPLTDARVPSVYRQIAAEPGDFAIMQIPFGWRNSFGTYGAERTQLEYYQSVHRKRTLTGNTSRAPSFKFDYFIRIPLFRALTEVELYQKPDAETLTRARAQAAELTALYDIRYLVVHDPIPLRYPEIDTTSSTRELALALMPIDPQPIARDGGATLYRVQQPPLSDPLHVDFGDWTSLPYQGVGWDVDEEVFGATANWAVGKRAEIFFPSRGGDCQLFLRIAPFSYPGAPPQRVALWLNGQRLENVLSLADGWQTVEVGLPAANMREGVNTLTLEFEHATPPASVLAGVSDVRPLAVAVDWFEVASR